MGQFYDSYFAQGLRLLDAGECEAASALFDRALRLGLGDLAEIHVCQAEAQACMKRYPAALRSIESALALQPYLASAYSARGDIHRARGKLDQAISDYTMAIHIEPNDADAWFSRALAYEERRRFAEAEADLTKTLELNPALGAAYETRGRLLARRFHYDAAIADIQRYLQGGYARQADNHSEMQGYLLVLRAQRILWRLLSRWRRR